MTQRLKEPLRRLLGASILRRPARAFYRAVTERTGIVVEVNGRSVRFSLGSEPVLIEPARAAHVAFADYVFSRAFCAAIRPGAAVADVGAFRGTYTLLAAVHAGERGEVTAFEPCEPSRRALRRNLAWNEFTESVEVRPEAVTDRPGEADFFGTSSSTNSLLRSGLLEVGPPDSPPVQRVPTTSLDVYYESAGRRKPDVIKIDVEGAEFAVLRGAEGLLAAGATVYCELHPYAWPEAGHSRDDLLDWLAARGRRLVDLRTGRRASGVLDYGPYLLEMSSAPPLT